ncbi:MAG: exopolysaccharide Pel transporter PelG [Lachnospiraceae bacterium]|nr:exopolysaccharide Pel transporter PelG [Lachnospiraceae bacterium]
MAGIGIRLNKIFNKNSIASKLVGCGYSVVVTIAPMLIIITVVVLMQLLLGFSKLDFYTRELYSCTVLYIFVFALLTTSPFNAVVSRYMSDIIYEERYEDIPPCFYMGLALNTILSFIPAAFFCWREYHIGGINIWYVFAGFTGYMCMIFTFTVMLYLSICKDYKKISGFYVLGMMVTLVLSLILHYIFGVRTDVAMLVSLDVGLLLIAVQEFSLFRRYFKKNSGNYYGMVPYLKKYWQLVVADFFYIFGLYVHNFVFWTTDWHLIVAKSFVCNQPYDMASCLAMFTNITASVIFITRVEMYFHSKYKAYSEAVIGGRGLDIQNAKQRMFRQLMEEIMTLVRVQFIVTTPVFMIAMILLPRFGFGGNTMRIYPCLTVGYFIMFIMYSFIIFLYYFNDLTGAVVTSVTFFIVTMLASIVATHLPVVWFGTGLVVGAVAGFSVAYYRMRRMEKTLDVHIFCSGSILKKGRGKMPSNLVYERK